MVWLTGGALTVAVSMIVGLMLLVLYNGSGTFWPVPITRVELPGGARLMGEITRVERYRLTKPLVDNLSGPLAEAAAAKLAGRDYADSERRLFRVGNFELTQTHFQWASDYEIALGSESRPEWAILAERVEWGRCVGELGQFVVRYRRVPSPDEEDLSSLVQWLETRLPGISEADRAPLEPALQRLRELVETRRRDNIREFLAQATSEATWRAVLEDGTEVALNAIEPGATVVELRQIWIEPPAAWGKFQETHPQVRERFQRRRGLERHEIGRVNNAIEDARLAVRSAEIATRSASLDKLEQLRQTRVQLVAQETEWSALQARWEVLKREAKRPDERLRPLVDAAESLLRSAREEWEQTRQEPLAAAAAIEAELAKLPEPLRVAGERLLDTQKRGDDEASSIQRTIQSMNSENDRFELRLAAADGSTVSVPLSNIVRAYPANRLNGAEALGIYLERWWEYLTDEPREANSEGGVFPAIFGTVAMTLIMSLAVVPFGVLAALYLREYARGGPIVSVVRISINNLAGVPSIVFGVFGLGFFCYLVGAFLDGGAANAGLQTWPSYAWYGGLFLLVTLALAAFVVGLKIASGERSRSLLWSRVALGLWLAATALLIALLFGNPHFGGFFADRLPNPTLGKGGILWASLTLALLTLPVVIVSTEESLSAVPNSMREGSYACGAGKWQTIRRIVLPQAMPGIMTGMILAMARGAGEVAPLMLVGAVKLAPELPIDNGAPFVHPERSFMHLGFHIYDLGFQSQNSEAAKPMVFTTTLLLIALVASLNVAAVWLRGRLRKRFRVGQF
jgi:ABC-type phosphate transport system permease subunit